MEGTQDQPQVLHDPERLEELIAYQEGSVVSRTLLKKATGNITVFAFDRGEGLSEHSTPHDAVVQILDGEAEVTVGGRLHRVGEGEGLLLPATVPHALHARSRFKMLLIMIRTPAD